MTVSSWKDVPAGTPCHHHCVVSVEYASDPSRWVDASTAAPDPLVWQYPDAITWVREQLEQHRELAEPHNQVVIDDRLSRFTEPDTTAVDHYASREYGYIPTTWAWLTQTLQHGGWVMLTFQLSPGRKLVMQLLGFADDRCRNQHARPADKPYLGLNKFQEMHAAQYA